MANEAEFDLHLDALDRCDVFAADLCELALLPRLLDGDANFFDPAASAPFGKRVIFDGRQSR